MGQHEIHTRLDEEQRQAFVQTILDDLRALAEMERRGLIESGVRRIGAELEMVLVDSACRPRPVAPEVLADLAGEPFTRELGLHNLETNLPPLRLGRTTLADLESEMERLLELARRAAAEHGARVLLCGILPTQSEEHLSLDWMTPCERYRQLNRTMVRIRGRRFRTLIQGLDELQVVHDNVMLEALSTSFQIHFQVGPEEFARLYNIAQVATAPVLAAAANAPLVLGHRLWHETRIALLQQSLDTRTEHAARLGVRSRVSFGARWVRQSVVEIFREDVARFRALIAAPTGESSLALLERGELPRLSALALHNGTIYRWNRPCFGVSDGVAHLRIENRALPAGPTILDQVANSAFFFGLMCGLAEQDLDPRTAMDFDHAKANFLGAARNGIDARMTWFGGRSVDADRLILDELLPMAHAGLVGAGVEGADVDRALGVIEARVGSRRTGARWWLDSLEPVSMGTPASRFQRVTATYAHHQETGRPVHEWPLGTVRDELVERESARTVGAIMSTNLFTVRPDDVLGLAAGLMDWKHVRHVPVENEEGELVGLLTHRTLLRWIATHGTAMVQSACVEDVMRPDPRTIDPDTPTLEAIALMREQGLGCLPIVRGKRLVGLVTQNDFVKLSARLLDRWLQADATGAAVESG